MRILRSTCGAPWCPCSGYATTPLCCPERATIWSGRVSHNNGVFPNERYDPAVDGTQGTGDTLDREWIIPRYLNDAGYRSALVGKFITNWHFATAEEGRYDIPQFDDYAVFQGGYTDGVGFRVKDPGQTTYHSESTADPEDSPDGDDSTDYIGHKTIEYVSAYEANATSDDTTSS